MKHFNIREMAAYLRLTTDGFEKALKNDYKKMPKKTIKQGKRNRYEFDKNKVLTWIQNTFKQDDDKTYKKTDY